MEKVIANRASNAGEKRRYQKARRKAASGLVRVPFEKMPEAEMVVPDIADDAPMAGTTVCPECGARFDNRYTEGYHPGTGGLERDRHPPIPQDRGRKFFLSG